jgi:hypothetical protein
MLAREALNTFNLKPFYFNCKWDKCYCENHFSKSMSKKEYSGNHTYVVPQGCAMFGLSIDPVLEQQYPDIWKWPISYHGFSSGALSSILSHRQLLLPGDVLEDGTLLKVRPGHIPGQEFIYTSPSWRYSLLPVYATPFKMGTWKVQFVFKCAQKPDSFQIQGETVGATGRICPEIPNDKLEWFSNRRGTIIPFALLVFISE